VGIDARHYSRLVTTMLSSDKKQKVSDWIENHNTDYANVRDRLEACRNVMLHGRIECAATMLETSYVNATMSIQTDKDRHEDAFVAHFSGGLNLKDAYLQTVYGGQKYDWALKTLANVDFETMVRELRKHVSHGRYGEYLDMLTDELTGVSYVKGAFTLAMVGIYEYACIDSNVRNAIGRDERKRYDRNGGGSEYMSDVRKIFDLNPYFPPFLVQWAIYDSERGEHARHMVFYREVLGL